MAKSLQEMASQGAAKLQAKSGTMAAAYNAAKSRMVSNFNALPFGPTMKSKYAAGVQNATYHTPDVSKWQNNWIAKVSE